MAAASVKVLRIAACLECVRKQTRGPGLLGESRVGRAVRGKVMGIKRVEVRVR